jgi:hypothetical protein
MVVEGLSPQYLHTGSSASTWARSLTCSLS